MSLLYGIADLWSTDFSVSTTTATATVRCAIDSTRARTIGVHSGVGSEVVARPATGVSTLTSVELGGVADAALVTPFGSAGCTARAFISILHAFIVAESVLLNNRIFSNEPCIDALENRPCGCQVRCGMVDRQWSTIDVGCLETKPLLAL